MDEPCHFGTIMAAHFLHGIFKMCPDRGKTNLK